MKITVKKLSELHKPAHNIRRHSEKQLTEYIRSIEMFGQVKPLVVAEDGEIIAGNGLYEALLRMGWETCDCYVMVGLTDVQKKKLMMADNKVYELGFTDVDAIEELVKELDGDVDVPGFISRKGIITMDYYDFVASAIAAVASLYNANAELAHLQKIGVKDVCVLWCGSTLQNNKAWLSTTVPDCMYYEATYDGDKKELRLDAYRKIQSVSIPC